MGQYDVVFRIRRRSAEASSRADERQTMRIGIAGAGAIGRSVALELLAYGHKVLLIENNVRHYEPHTVPDADWLLADACELTSLEDAGMQTCDVVIAATGDDKVNLTASLLAKTEFGVTGWWRGSTTPAMSGCSPRRGASTSRSRRHARWSRRSRAPSTSATWCD